MTPKLCGRRRAGTFVVACAPTEIRAVGEKHVFGIILDGVVKEVPEPERLFVLMGPNERAGRRGGRELGSSKNCKILGADGRDTLNDNDQSWACIVGYIL